MSSAMSPLISAQLSLLTATTFRRLVLVCAAVDGATISEVPDTPFSLHGYNLFEVNFPSLSICTAQGPVPLPVQRAANARSA